MCDNTYCDLLNIDFSLKNLKVSNNKDSKHLILDFNEEKNDLIKFKKMNYFMHKILINEFFENIINEYITGLMLEFLSLDPLQQKNIFKLINYYEFTIKICNDEQNKNLSRQKLQKFTNDINQFINLMIHN